MIEKAPDKLPFSTDIMDIMLSQDYQESLKRIEKDYLYWDKAKYYFPKNISPEKFWTVVKFSRLGEAVVFDRTVFTYKITSYMQKILHEFDMNFGGTIMSSGTISSKNKQYYLLSSIMEEAIASSQMEGANTTRRVAKDMLRKQAKAKNRDQQMIVNNYNTIRYLAEHKNEPLTPDLLLEIHRRISEKTLINSDNEGKFREDDNIVVMDDLRGEIAHTSPSHTSINQSIC